MRGVTGTMADDQSFRWEGGGSRTMSVDSPFPPCPSPLRHELRSLVDRLGIGAPAQNGNRIATRVKICGTRRTWRTEDLESNSPISGRLNENWRAGVMRRERTLVGAEVKFKLDDGCSLRLKQVMVL